MGRVITSFTRPKPVTGGFYFCPGYNAGGFAELWTTDGVTVTKVWTAPSNLLGITYLAHLTSTGMLYIFCDDYTAAIGSDFDVNVYKLNPLTNAVSHFAGPYQYADHGITNDKPAVHAAEYSGALYVGHQGGHAPSWGAYVTRITSTGAVSLVAQATGTDNIDLGAGQFDPQYTGGLGVAGGNLYWTDGAGFWVNNGFDYYLGYPDPTFPLRDIDGFGTPGNPVTNPLDGNVYWPGQYAGDETLSPDNGYGTDAHIHRYIMNNGGGFDDLGSFSNTDAPSQGGAFYNRVACCAMLYDVDDLTPLAAYALDDGVGFGTDGPINTIVWRRSGGVWSSEVDLQSVVPGCHGISNSMKSSKGEMFVTTYTPAPSQATYLLKRTVGGAWSIFHTFAGYVPEDPDGTLPDCLPIGRVHPTIKCHEM